ncbi:hypothetical protein ABCS02_31695 [Microbacterium sp. X-17]|uniref:hypothetical protein n=1 Tax=Microbacterium sp. X-17 TaxID=3144404 RepID=UPI0031F530B9
MKREELPDRRSSWGRAVDPVAQEELLVPPYSSAEATIARSARSRAGELHTIRFFPDHGHDWPLWDPNFGYTVTPDHYGLSDELATALRRWYDEWEAAVGPGDGWRDAAEHDKWLERGDELCDWLTQELWDSAEIIAEHRAE